MPLTKIDENTYKDLKSRIELSRDFDSIFIVINSPLSTTDFKTGIEKDTKFTKESLLESKRKILHLNPNTSKRIFGNGYLCNQQLGVIKPDSNNENDYLISKYDSQKQPYDKGISVDISPDNETGAFLYVYEDNSPDISIKILLKEDTFNDVHKQLFDNPNATLQIQLYLSSFCETTDRNLGHHPYSWYIYVENDGAECLVQNVAICNKTNPFLKYEDTFEGNDEDEEDNENQKLLKRIYYALLCLIFITLLSSSY